ncbi:MAG: aldolase [Chloroflexi bacterium]|nr:MAG: aldolase [Chloroflexota bacterium]
MSTSIIVPNKMKQALQAGKRLFGTMVVEFRQPSVMQLLANAGLDFAIIDNEHGPFSVETIADLSRMARLVGVTPIVRVPQLEYPYVAQSLDGGAQGVMIPRVFGVDDVLRAVEITRFPPRGRRGNSLSRGYTNFRGGSTPEAMAASNAETLLVIQIETAEAVENLEAITSVPDVDICLIGPNDLSIALGVPGQLDSPVLHAAIQKTIDVCVKNGVYPALHINSVEWANYWLERGMRIISTFSEAGYLTQGCARVVQAMKG